MGNMRTIRPFITAILGIAMASLSAQDRGLLVVRTKDGSQVGSFRASYALVIGESQYALGWPKLAGVRTDIQLVSKALEGAGFRVTTKQDLSSEELSQAYKDFIDSYGLDEGNRLLFYYAGHGQTMKLAGGRDMGYIVPIDAPLPSENPTGFKKKALDMQQFSTWAQKIESRHALFLFDSCFSGSIFNTTRAAPDNINEKTVKAVRQFITSGSADEQVPDRSIFRDQFLAGIGGEADRNGDGYVTGTELGEFLDEKVVNYSHNSQHPQIGKIQDPALDKGDFVFASAAGAKAGANQASASAATGIAELMVRAEGGAEVFVDGVSYGKAPALVKKLDAGRPLKVMARTASLAGSLDVTLNPGETRELSIALSPLSGNLFVKANEAAVNLWVDGVDKGPLGSGLLKGIPIGPHQLELKGPGLYGSASANVPANETVEVKAQVKAVGQIDFDVPEGASVRLAGSGSNAGITGSRIGSGSIVYVPIGDYGLSAGGNGFMDEQATVTIRKGERASWKPYAGGAIAFAVQPPLSSFSLDSSSPDTASGTLRGVPPGSHTLVFKKPGYRDATVSLNVEYGKLARAEVTLAKFAPATLRFPDFGLDISLGGSGASRLQREQGSGQVAYAIEAGLPLKLGFSSPYAERLDIPSVQASFAEGEERSLDIATGTIFLPWLPADATVSIGSGTTLALRNASASAGFRSQGLPIGTYRITVSGALPYSSTVEVRAGSLSEPEGYRRAMGETLASTKSGFDSSKAKASSSAKTHKILGWASLGIGLAASAVSAWAYLDGNSAYSGYSSAIFSADAESYRSKAETDSLIMSLSGVLAGIGLVGSPVSFFTAPKVATFDRQIEIIDNQIKLLNETKDSP